SLLDVDPARPLLCFDVRDTGIGLSEEQITHLFQPFVQADNSTTRRFGGTGLGLSISRRFAQMLGGDITVTSTLGQGSTFRVTIAAGNISDVPVSEPAAPAAITLAASTTTTSTADLKGKRILVAEDGPDNQRILSLLLRKAGAQVCVVENGALAVQQVAAANQANEPFDLILMDMQMPVLDGYGATAELRAQGVRTPIIALTAHAMRGDRERCLAAGCDDYATKPIERQEFFAVLSRQCERGAANIPR
ncbi:MAG TPA: response regulator, partial [Pirellulaceae bacterium]|nr:response regulator [Pirellulaceae bacterium]